MLFPPTPNRNILHIRTEKTTTCPQKPQERNSKATVHNAHPKPRHAAKPGTPQNHNTPRSSGTPHRGAKNPRRWLHLGSESSIDGKNASTRGNRSSNLYQLQKQAKASLSQLLRRRAPSQLLRKRTSSQAGYTNRTPASGPGVMEYTSSTCIQHTPLE